MSKRATVLGAGFGGLELSTKLSEALGDAIEVMLIDKSDGFVFGFSKLDLMFAGAAADEVRMPYDEIAKLRPRSARDVEAIDPEARPDRARPAPSKCALLLDDALRARGVREDCRISFVIPLSTPVPPSTRSAASCSSTTATSCRSTSSSACRNTARPRWSSTAA